MATEASSAPLALPQEINAATRSAHTTLNRLITSRLPLALPPHAASPGLYAHGLQHFAHVYLTFESAWNDLPPPSPSPSSSSSSHTNPALSSLLSDPATPPINPRIHALLTSLLPPGLPRSRRLRRDLAALLRLPAVDLDVQLSRYPGPAAAAFAAHIRGAVAARPHVLVAYAWVMYMAVFSGGRWIRAQFRGAEAGWWGRGTDIDVPAAAAAAAAEGEGEEGQEKGAWLADAGLAFFHFDGACDGEDIKAEFKRRLEGLETVLTPAERADVVAEAGEIFGRCAELVGELDGLLDTPAQLPSPLRHDAPAAGTEKAGLKQNGEQNGEQSEKGKVTDKEREEALLLQRPVSQLKSKAWLRRTGVAGGVLVLGAVYWYAACCLSKALREGWDEGWANI